MARKVEGYRAINVRTGEVLDILVAPERRKIRGRWMRVFLDTQRRLALDTSIHGQTRRILSYLMAVSDYINRVPGPSEVARAMGLGQPPVSRAYAELKRVGVLIAKGRDYYLSPELCWRGSPEQYTQACQDLLSSPPLLKSPW